jgi:hypothetical protein
MCVDQCSWGMQWRSYIARGVVCCVAYQVQGVLHDAAFHRHQYLIGPQLARQVAHCVVHEECEAEEHVQNVETVCVRHGVTRLTHQATQFNPQLSVCVNNLQNFSRRFLEFLSKHKYKSIITSFDCLKTQRQTNQ